MSSDLLFSTQTPPFYPFEFVPGTVDGGGTLTYQNALPNTVIMITDIDISSHDATVACIVTIEDENGKVFFSDSTFLEVAANIYYSWRGLRFLGYEGEIVVQQVSEIDAPALDVTVSGWVMQGPLFTLEHL